MNHDSRSKKSGYYIYQQAVGVQDWPFSAALSLIFTLAVTGIVFAVGALSRRYVRGVDAA
ncbi:ABC-type spermidine/putrescine transport system permease subunit I [Bradyrhizobium liaoningense]